MIVLNIIKNFLKKSPIFNFNSVERDIWISDQAKRLPAGSRVLDAGAGSCPYRKCFSHCYYETQDFINLKDNQLNGGGYGKIDYVCDISCIPVPDKRFDAVLCSEVLEHVPDPVSVIAEFKRILKSGGKLILTAPLGSGIHQEPYHFYGGYTPYWYERILNDNDFEMIKITPNGGSFKAFGQEAQRFVRMTIPFSKQFPFLISLVWLPFWLLLLPVLGGFLPLAANFIDKFDHEQRFTVGYFVSAVRR